MKRDCTGKEGSIVMLAMKFKVGDIT